MNPIEYKITLDCRRAESQVIITAKQGEASGRKITFSLNEGRLPYKVPSGVTAVLRAKKPSGAVLYNTCTVTADGNVEYIITTQTVAEVGKLPCELQLSQDGKVIFSPNFTLLVYKNLSVDSEVESSDEFTALQAAISRAENLTDGTTFTPTVSEDGVLSWTNDGGKANPDPVNIKGPQGEDGAFRINVTYSDGKYSADKTFDEIKAAYDAGQQPYVVQTGGTLDLVYTLASFSVPDGTGHNFVDFKRYLIWEDTLETETLRIYSYTTDSGSNIENRTSSFNVPNNSYVLLVTGTESTGSDIPLTSEQVADLQNAAQNNIPITMILRDGNTYIAYYPFLVGNTSMMFSRGCNFNSVTGSVDVNQALGRILVASVNLAEGANKLSFLEFPSGLTRFLPLSLNITWTADANSYTLTDNEYAILRQSLLDKRPIYIVRNTADVGGAQSLYILQTGDVPSIYNVDSMTLILQGLNDSIKVQMSDKTIVPNAEFNAPGGSVVIEGTVSGDMSEVTITTPDAWTLVSEAWNSEKRPLVVLRLSDSLYAYLTSVSTMTVDGQSQGMALFSLPPLRHLNSTPPYSIWLDESGGAAILPVESINGADGIGIQSVEQTTTSAEDGGPNVITVTKTDGTSSTFTVRNGSKGSTGATGATGPQGERGPQGEQGIQGPAGPTGPQGPAGNDGYTPVKGVDYFDGVKGDKGDKGAQGPQGDTGPQGPAGAAGEDGYTPVRGTDYWTADDIAAIQSYINEKAAALQSKSITDSGGHFTTDTVEGALQEIGAELAGINTLLGSGIQISFTIDGETFSVVSGTTWAEWIGGYSRVVSETSGLTLYNNGHVLADEAGAYAVSLDGSTAVSVSDTIVSGATYTIINWGG